MNFKALLILFFTVNSCSAQNYLLCRKNTRSARIMEGSEVAYSLHQDSAPVKGVLSRVLDSSIVINNIDTILVSDLVLIRVYNDNFGLRLLKGLGRELPKAGVLYLALGTLNSWIFNYPPLLSWRRTIIAASISATGFIFKGLGRVVDHKTYRSRSWYFVAMSFDGLNVPR